ncbi:MAG TPA: trypsin-like peptidase domain-containing protein [Cyclobacteriaceae bacterium]|jgi:serine protease Do|nr:trypsin-like peptidase domain-containing protein [Cytophagales bacterium]HNT50902.1 trypsin-like peptidase domain-containing protein [Cyclobacteriaceae bacterium]HRE67879.1 trypsin-like peptidase domain-containing protein [Cyclobacteriaceae bacterium]HRF33839.1 trypsin-like peptidase domain-containing protein [Cyclobacteriaceae bacterium]
MKRLLLILLVACAAFIGAITGSIFTLKYFDGGPAYTSIEERQNLKLTNYAADTVQYRNVIPINFQTAAKLVTPAVVHISTIYGGGRFSLNALEQYLNPHSQSSGSGVIISDDGYIVTNNHVIENANSIEITLHNNQRFFAKLVGQDPNTDLALLKIKAHDLPFVKYGNSDDVSAGEWVLAIGNPFNLNSTVTAGIVSAKARNIDILRNQNNLQIESFIQTDAAVNPGNSGGALVNLKGELIGINSAIATATGSFDGYSFAIPVSLVKKIMDDLLEFGSVQRGLLGVQINNVTPNLAENRNLNVVQGVFVSLVNKGSAAESSGIEPGDVIVAIDNHPVAGVSELQEWVARKRPGQSVIVKYLRNGVEKEVLAKLKNFEGSETMREREVRYELEGAQFEDVPYSQLTELNLDGGVLIKKLDHGKWKTAGVKENMIITHIDKVAIDNVKDLNRAMEMKKGGVLIEGLWHGEKQAIGLEW